MKHLYNDWDAVVGRAKGLWAPRWRTASVGTAGAAQASGTALTARDTETADADAAVEGRGAAGAEGQGGEEGGGGGANLDGGEQEDEWGGRGSPTEVVVAKEDGGEGAAVADATTAAAGGEETVVVQAGGGETGQQGKGRWHRGAWSAVDVRSVQSRLSRIVDDTSARIRSNIVKVGVAL